MMHGVRRFLVVAVLVVLTSGPGLRAEQTYRMEESIPYRTGADLTPYMQERCFLHLYYPEGATNFATVVWFHGGGLRGGEPSIPNELKEQGLAVAAVAYRLFPKVKEPAYIEDAAAAVAWVFKHIQDYGGSPDRIFVSGHSAGGYLTSMIGLDNRWLAVEGVEADRIAGLIPFSGHTITHFTVREERGLPGTKVIVDELAPLYYVRADAPPMLLITGDRQLEMLGRYEENAYFWRMMQIVGHPDCTLYELDGFNHGGMCAPALDLMLKFVRRVNATIAD